MPQRFLIIVDLPELRPDPILADKSTTELEAMIPIDVYWQIEEVLKNMRFARVSNLSTEKYWKEFNKLIYPCLVIEKHRMWYKRNIG
jgi:hypothetical protein